MIERGATIGREDNHGLESVPFGILIQEMVDSVWGKISAGS